MTNLVDRRTGAVPRAVDDSVVAVADDDLEPGDDLGAGPGDAPEDAEGSLPPLTPVQLLSQTWRLVQNLADTLPDRAVRHIRAALAHDDPAGAVSALVFACLQHGTPLSGIEYAVLAECVIAVGEDASVLDAVTVTDVERQVVFEFVAEPGPGDLAGADTDAATQEAVRALDERMLRHLTEDPDAVLGVWRAWRYPVTSAAYPPPTPVYLVEAVDDVAALELALSYYREAGDGAPEADPVVEIYGAGTELPPLQRAAQFAGELLHTSSSADELDFADVFDGEPDETGRPQHLEQLAPEDAARLEEYLMAGTPLLVADSSGEDVLDPSRGRVVPLHLRTDGRWVWSDASVYYLREHLVAPPAAFRAYVDAQPELPARVGDATLHQVIGWLQSE